MTMDYIDFVKFRKAVTGFFIVIVKAGFRRRKTGG